MAMPRVLAALAAAVCLGLMTAAPAPAADREITASGVLSSDGTVSLVAAVTPLPAPPLDASAFSASADGTDLRLQATPLLPTQAAVAFVVDASADGARALSSEGRSGAAGFLLQLPPAATTVVVADRVPATVVAGPFTGVSPGLTAVSGLRSTGNRDTVAAIDLALSKLPAWPAVTPVVVLHTSAADAGGEAAAALAARLQKAHAVLAVVTTAGSAAYWSQVTEATGGLAVSTTPAKSIIAFDEIADGLRSRYVIGVTRPATGSAIDLKVGAASTTVALPPESAAAPPSSGLPRSSSDGGSSAGRIVLIVVVVLLVLSALAVLVLLLARPGRNRWGARPPRQPEPAAEEEPAFPYAVEVRPGVRVYEGADLFEPRSARDAREGPARPAPRSTSRLTPRPRPPQTPQTPRPVVTPTENPPPTPDTATTNSKPPTSPTSVPAAGSVGSGSSAASSGSAGAGGSGGSGSTGGSAGSGSSAGSGGSDGSGSTGGSAGSGSSAGSWGSDGSGGRGQPPTAREVAEHGANLFRPAAGAAEPAHDETDDEQRYFDVPRGPRQPPAS